MSTQTGPNLATRILRLLAFATLCVVIGLVVLTGMCAPNINPSFLNNFLFRQTFSETERDAALALSTSAEAKYLRGVFGGLEHAMKDSDFARLKDSKPEDVDFKTADGLKLHGWFFNTPGAQDTVLFNWSGLCDTRLPVLLGYIKILKDAKYSVLLYDYRGFGSSEGKPSLASTVSDGEAAYTYLVDGRHIKPETIILMGRTVGAHVACELSSKHPCKAIVLEEPWTNVKNFVDSHPMTIGSRMVPAWLYPGDAYDNSKFLKGEHPPLLIVGYSPSQQGPYNLYEQASMPKRYLQLMELDGFIFPNLPEQSQRYTSRLTSLLDTTAPSQSSEPATAESTAPFEWQTDLKSAISDAKRLHKSILVDVYTDWCGPCKMLDKYTYSNKTLQNYLSANFILVKANAENAKNGQAIAKKFDVQAYPTILLVDTNGHVFGKLVGFMTADQFLRMVRGFAM